MASKILGSLLKWHSATSHIYARKISPLQRISKSKSPYAVRYRSSSQLESSRTISTDVLRSYDPRWLRENCRCSSCFNHSTEQRNILFYELEQDQTKIIDIKLDESKNEVSVIWADGHESSFKRDWLEKNTYPGDIGKIEKILWDAATMGEQELDLIPCETFLNDVEGLKRLLMSLLVYGFGIVDNVEATMEATQRVTERVCFVQETLFGRMWSFTSDLARADTAYTNTALGAHTDNTYLSVPAGIQVFHCTKHDGTGGRTLLVDGFNAAEKLRSDHPNAFDTLCKYRVYHENKDRDLHYVRSLDPVLEVHPTTKELEILRYNHYDRTAICTIPQGDLPGYYDALAALSSRITDPKGEFWIKLKPGMVMFIDNWRVLHGRDAFTGLRRVCGCYLPRDDWIGRARVLKMIP